MANVDDFEVTSSSETPEQIQAALDFGSDPVGEDPGKKAEAAPPESQADGDAGEPEPDEDDLSKYSANEIHRNPALRIKKATAVAAAAKREAEEARSRLAAYESELTRLRQITDRQTDKNGTAVSNAEPQEADFDEYKDYVKAQARWQARQEFEERQAQAQEAERAAMTAEGERLRAEKFQAAIKEAGGKAFLDTISEDVLNIGPKTPVGWAITESDNPARLMKHLTENPDVYRALSGMQPILAVREMGRIEGKLEGVAVTATAPRAPVSKAKPPVRPVAGTPSVGDELSDDAPFEEYFRHMNAKERSRHY